MSTTNRRSAIGLAVLGFLGGTAFAAPGDIHRLRTDAVNLHTGPTGASNGLRPGLPLSRR